MTQEQKDLLLKDLCMRLPYGVKYMDILNPNEQPSILQSIDECGLVMASDGFSLEIENVKPYLFPLSNMTDEQYKIYHELICGMFSTNVLINYEALTDFFNKNHFDYRGLIRKGLAIDANGLNIYKEDAK